MQWEWKKILKQGKHGQQNKVEQKAFNLFTPPTVRSIPGQPGWQLRRVRPKSFTLLVPPSTFYHGLSLLSSVSPFQRFIVVSKQNTKKKKEKKRKRKERKERAFVLLLLGFCLFGAARKLLWAQKTVIQKTNQQKKEKSKGKNNKNKKRKKRKKFPKLKQNFTSGMQREDAKRNNSKNFIYTLHWTK